MFGGEEVKDFKISVLEGLSVRVLRSCRSVRVIVAT